MRCSSRALFPAAFTMEIDAKSSAVLILRYAFSDRKI
ncbi:hypothetical protein SY94_5478 (plasmid) [Agrobacterium tumefaciens]|nr:hypothetical protein SY94_5478 [Agrobacterium tumefaciens]